MTAPAVFAEYCHMRDSRGTSLNCSYCSGKQTHRRRGCTRPLREGFISLGGFATGVRLITGSKEHKQTDTTEKSHVQCWERGEILCEVSAAPLASRDTSHSMFEESEHQGGFHGDVFPPFPHQNPAACGKPQRPADAPGYKLLCRTDSSFTHWSENDFSCVFFRKWNSVLPP